MIITKNTLRTVNTELVGLHPVPGAPQRIAPLEPDFAAAIAYGQGKSSVAAGPASSIIQLQVDPYKGAGRLRALYHGVVAGKALVMPEDELAALQATALWTLKALFTNQFGTDTELLAQVGSKLGALLWALPSDAARAKIHAGTSALEQQQDALNLVLRTFQGRDEADDALRRAVFQKLGDLGRRSDIGAIMPHLRKGTSSDLYHGLQAVHAITAKKALPYERGGLSSDPEIGPLLKKDSLSGDERTRLIEAVLERGEIASTQALSGAGNANPVYFIRFKETLPGPSGKRVPIEGVFKPETTYLGKDRAYFSREVAAYQFDKRFAHTELVPPTVEALIKLDGVDHHDLGSLQYKVPRSKPLGGRPPGQKDQFVPANWRDPEHDAFCQTPHFKKRMAQVRTLAYVFNDPDKLGNNVFPTDNLGNILVCTLDDGSKDLRMIDNSLIAGQSVAPGQDVSEAILPNKADAPLVAAMHHADHGAVVDALAPLVRDEDAEMVAHRLEIASEKLGGGKE